MYAVSVVGVVGEATGFLVGRAGTALIFSLPQTKLIIPTSTRNTIRFLDICIFLKR